MHGSAVDHERASLGSHAPSPGCATTVRAMTADNPLGTILGVWAHPDDETWLCAGLMARAVRAGDRVVCITATRGELGSPDEERWPSGAPLAAVRTAEMAAALAVLGVTEHHWLDYPDGGCAGVDQDEAVRRVDRGDGRGAARHGADLRARRHDRPRRPQGAPPAGRRRRSGGRQARRGRWATRPTRPEWLADFREPLDRFNVFMGSEPPCTPARRAARRHRPRAATCSTPSSPRSAR